MPLSGAFTALILLFGGLSAAVVLPPANVTVSCQNVTTTATWEYPNLQPQTSFRVRFRVSDEWHHEEETTELQYDLSPFVWKDENYMEYLYVTVTAVQGVNQSEAVQSNSFSYNKLKAVHKKCVVNFPHVDVSVSDSGVAVRFQNPLNLYEELRHTRVRSEDTARFTFTVYTDLGETDGFCSVKESSCKVDVSIPTDVEKCVTIKGLLFDEIGVNQVVFEETKKMCVPDSSVGGVIVLAGVLLCFLGVVIGLIVFFILRTKAWKIEDAKKRPKCLEENDPRQNLKYNIVSRDDISPVTIHVTPKRLSVSSEDDLQDHSTGSHDKPNYREERLSGSSSEELDIVGYEGNGADNYSADDSEKTETISLDTEEERSPYDCPHRPQFVEVDMGHGEKATGYTG